METKEIRQTKSNEEIKTFLNNEGLSYFSIAYCGCNGFFIPESGSKYFHSYPAIFVTKSNKDICRIYPHQIIYIAIEERKSVLHLTDRKIETHYSMDYWKKVLDEKIFAQPHYSYMVNLSYVEEVTKNFVTLKCGENEYKIYASLRKIGSFKKSVLEFGQNSSQ